MKRYLNFQFLQKQGYTAVIGYEYLNSWVKTVCCLAVAEKQCLQKKTCLIAGVISRGYQSPSVCDPLLGTLLGSTVVVYQRLNPIKSNLSSSKQINIGSLVCYIKAFLVIALSSSIQHTVMM